MRRSLLAVAAGAAVLTLSLPGEAAPVSTLLYKDVTGDANGLNGQGLIDEVPGDHAGPVQRGGADIESVSYRTAMAGGKRSLIVTLSLTAAPEPATTYRVTQSTATCESYSMAFQYAADGTQRGYLRHDCPGFVDGGLGFEDATVSVKAVDKSVVWTIPLAGSPGALKTGTLIENLGAHTRLSPPGATPLQLDDVTHDGVYKVG